jgi:hypothetical protein
MATPAARTSTKARSQQLQVARKAKKAGHPSVAASMAKLDIVPDWDQLPELKELSFDELAEKRQKLYDEIEFRKSKMKELDEEISAALAVAGTEKVIWEGRPVQIVHSRSGSKIVGEKLLMLGVAADTIAQATEEGKPYEYVLFGRPKDKK